MSTVVEKNRLIAEGNLAIMLFDGWTKKTGYTFDPDHNGGKNDYVYYEKDTVRVREEDIPYDIVYHQSWDALMPAIKKFISMQGQPMPSFMIHVRNISAWLERINIEEAYKNLVYAIQWYNTTQSK